MSAFIVSDHHVTFILQVAVHVSTSGGHSLLWYWGGCHGYLTGKPEQLDVVGQMLLDENARSVAHRYPTTQGDDLPGSPVGSYKYRPGVPSQVIRGTWHAQALKAIACLEYQSCEHPGWKASEACAFLRALEGRIVGMLPGYADAKWTIDEPQAAPGVLSMMDILNGRGASRG